MSNEFSKCINPVMLQLENTFIQQSESGEKPNFTEETFRAATFIFMSVLVDKIVTLGQQENIPASITADMAEKCGNELHVLVKTYTGIDTHDLYP